MYRRRLFLLCVATGGLLVAPAVARLGPSFSLDDNPANPLTSPAGWIPGFGAEDPYGLGTFGGPLAPSPTLPAPPAMDADILEPSPAGGPVPVIDVGMSLLWNGRFGYVDAVSDNSYRGRPVAPVLHLGFSVDRISRGLAGSDVHWQRSLNQQPGDVFRTQAVYPHPKQFVGTPAPVMGYAGPLPVPGPGGGGNHLLFDESRLNLTAGNGVGGLVGPAAPCPVIRPGSHDNTDAVNWQRFNDSIDEIITGRWLYFSVAPDERAVSGFGPGDIYVIPPGNPPAAAHLYASAASMGLFHEAWEYEDNVDALVVWEDPFGEPDMADPGRDFALFSLSHGSPSLAMHGLREADIFFTDFTGAFWLYADAKALGLYVSDDGEAGDNVDALEVIVPGDADLDGDVDLDDFAILKHYFGVGTSWLQGDFDGDGDVDLDDFVILKTHFGLTEGGP